MPPFLRSILAVLLGIVVGMLVVMAGDALVGRLFPLAPGVDPNDPTSLAQAIAAMPIAALLMLLVGWVTAAAVGAGVAARLARRAPVPHGLIVAAIILAATVANLILIPHPTWMLPAACVLIPVAGWVGVRLATRRAPRA